MRPINPETGKPYPRSRPIDWASTRRILRWRQADKRIRDQGFVRVNAFAALPWEPPAISHRIVAAAIHPDGQSLYVKIEPKHPATSSWSAQTAQQPPARALGTFEGIANSIL